jgi:hypothetical protein
MKTDSMVKRLPQTDRTPRFMHQQEFDDEAALLLAEYGQEHGIVTAPPIPIDEIIEEHLKIAVEIRNLRAEYPEGDVLGAIYFNDKRIAIDQSLVPEDFPAMRGRYRFTLAHELAHWRLHRHLYLRRVGERTLLPTVQARPDHVLRRSSHTDPKEVQANRLAAALLMPREMLKRAWHEWRGSMDPIYLEDLQPRRQQILTAEVLCRGGFKSGDDAEANMLFEHACRPLAETFEVSPDAMRIRLEGMNLLLRKKEPTLFK